jgi:hypothetical protein
VSRSALLGGPDEIPVSECERTRRAESRLGEPTKQNAGERRARLGLRPSSEAVPDRPGEQNQEGTNNRRRVLSIHSDVLTLTSSPTNNPFSPGGRG